MIGKTWWSGSWGCRGRCSRGDICMEADTDSIELARGLMRAAAL